jgi:hypothetical protein
MFLKSEPNRKLPSCEALRVVTDERGAELCAAPAQFAILLMTHSVMLCRAHASALFLELKKDLGQ